MNNAQQYIVNQSQLTNFVSISKQKSVTSSGIFLQCVLFDILVRLVREILKLMPFVSNGNRDVTTSNDFRLFQQAQERHDYDLQNYSIGCVVVFKQTFLVLFEVLRTVAHRSRIKTSRSESPKYNFGNHGKIVKTLNFLQVDVCMVNDFISEQKLMRLFV